MKKIKAVSIIRSRGQITIPDDIRKAVAWMSPDAVVTVSLTDTNEIRIQPYAAAASDAVDWDEVWTRIEAARKVMGKRKRGSSLSAFIAKDRKTRR